MTIDFEERAADSPYIESVTHGYTLSDGSALRPAEIHWHMVLVKHSGGAQALAVGPWTTAGTASWGEGAEILWIKFKLGTFMPQRPTKQLTDCESVLPGAAGQSFWLNSSAWQFPDYHNVETFISRLAREDALVRDPLINAALNDQLPDISSRTLRHRFIQATGLTQSHIRQFKRAQQAAAMLAQGMSILDTVHEAGYFDQPHLTRSLKRFIGKTPAQQIALLSQLE
jgi:AraC-like DNA-binding protein